LPQGNLETALKITQAATARFPWDQSLLQTQGTVQGRLGRPNEARECYRRSIEIRPAAPAYVAWALLEDSLATRLVHSDGYSAVYCPAKYSTEAGGGVGGVVGLHGETGAAAGAEIDKGGAGAGRKEEGHGGRELAGIDGHEEARRLFGLGLRADPTHGPLYNAFG
ncbi:unnamed protein product, partial [Discosporangium mesarthrocarpum]